MLLHSVEKRVEMSSSSAVCGHILITLLLFALCSLVSPVMEFNFDAFEFSFAYGSYSVALRYNLNE